MGEMDMRTIIHHCFTARLMKTFTIVLLLLVFFISGTGLSYSEPVRKKIASEVTAQILAEKANGAYVEGPSQPPVSENEYALPIIDCPADN